MLGKTNAIIPDVNGKEDKSNKVISISNESTDIQYPSAKCVYDKFATYFTGNSSTVVADTTFIQAYDSTVKGSGSIVATKLAPSKAFVSVYCKFTQVTANSSFFRFGIPRSMFSDLIGFNPRALCVIPCDWFFRNSMTFNNINGIFGYGFALRYNSEYDLFQFGRYHNTSASWGAWPSSQFAVNDVFHFSGIYEG